MVDSINVKGLRELDRTLKQLPARLGEKVMRAALRAAGQVIRKDAITRVPILKAPSKYRKPGTVKRAIVIKRSRKDKFGVYVTVRGLKAKQIKAFKGGKVNKAAAQNPDDPFYWLFLEFGTAKLTKTPFLRPAFEAKKFEALRKFEEYCKKRIVKEAEKLARELGSIAA
jgi:HK97 gp10 family phage protein